MATKESRIAIPSPEEVALYGASGGADSETPPADAAACPPGEAPAAEAPTAPAAPAAGAPHEAQPAEAVATPEADIEKLRVEVKEWRDRCLRAQAESQNIARRLTEEKEAVVRYANATFIKALLPVLDNFERTLDNLDERHQNDPVILGVRLVYDLLRKTLADHRVEPIEALGKPFDPALHEALMQVESKDQPPGTVVQELERGYKLHDRVLRAAKVAVAKEASNQ